MRAGLLVTFTYSLFVLGVPAASFLGDLAVSLENGEDSVEIVGLDPEARRELRDGDPRLTLNQGERFGRSRSAAFGPSTASFLARRGFARGFDLSGCRCA